VADSVFGFAADSAQFALTTGVGDMTGVFCGHMLYKTIEKRISTKKIDMDSESKTAMWLGTGALFAGSSWQPVVNMLHDTMGLGFTPTFLGTTMACGGMFFAGLYAGRSLYSWMPKLNTDNAKQDLGLCLSIGGATAMFVATDPSFVGSQADLLYNLIAPAFNITDTHSTISGCAIAGSSTLTGYAIYNSMQNALLPPGANWQDQNNPFYDAEDATEEEVEADLEEVLGH
jgi:hypothetical protein